MSEYLHGYQESDEHFNGAHWNADRKKWVSYGSVGAYRPRGVEARTYKPYEPPKPPYHGVDKDRWPRTWHTLVMFYHSGEWYQMTRYNGSQTSFYDHDGG